jgi:glucosamine kinase
MHNPSPAAKNAATSLARGEVNNFVNTINYSKWACGAALYQKIKAKNETKNEMASAGPFIKYIISLSFILLQDFPVTQNIFIGIDGGGTTSRVRIENDQGDVLGHAVGGPANIRLSVEGAWHSILTALDEALSQAQISLHSSGYRFHVGMGLAGSEVKEAYQAFIDRDHLFTTLHVVSDAHIACMGAHQGKEGAIIIVGTGVIGYEIFEGQGTRVSGWGFPHDDEGGGAWLGLEAARLTFQWLDHRAEKSPLVEDIFSFFNQDREEFVAWANRANATEFARLAPLVINHSQQEEVAAVRLVKKAAHAVDRVGVALQKLRTRKEETFPCALMGGIAPFIEPWLSESLRAHLVPREAEATVGAILMIREHVHQKALSHV